MGFCTRGSSGSNRSYNDSTGTRTSVGARLTGTAAAIASGAWRQDRGADGLVVTQVSF
jgi:hypothetical protein